MAAGRSASARAALELLAQQGGHEGVAASRVLARQAHAGVGPGTSLARRGGTGVARRASTSAALVKYSPPARAAQNQIAKRGKFTSKAMLGAVGVGIMANMYRNKTGPAADKTRGRPTGPYMY